MNEDLEKIINKAKELNYKFIYSDCDYWDGNNKIISIKSRSNKKIEIIYALHEAGHALLFEDDDFDHLFRGHKKTTKSCKIAEIEIEILAWQKAKFLAKNLQIPLDNSFTRIKNRCLNTYLNL